ncbi:putative acyl-CoA dehydrogenase [Neohortaea acidophila]|uniref:Putative acyl-CoA dehydrogenase n=1 Tax=Neohortaea acidophila TaxID=245834 RepID=A0A6A6Q1D6_9PEZI|nr:putative acyl-CoA dehydrogenase [Neohortaea acidophila]KAF2486065.1 putative acyl-CoA dehydrogenase [Neohortaea acidophila]
MLDFTLSDKQKELRNGSRAYAAKVLTGAHAVYSKKPDQKERFRSIRSFYRTAVAAGQIKGQIPVPLGGACESLLDAAIILEELYATDPSVTLTVAATGLGLTPLIMSGHAKLQKKYFAPFLKDEGEPLASLVHSEPGGTANWLEKGAKGLQTTARKEGNEWLIDGEKVWTTNSGGWDGKGADLQCVVCRQTEGEFADPSQAIIILLVDREIVAQNGPNAYEILAEPDLMGHPATTGPHSKFTDFRVPEENVLAAGEAAATLVEQSFTASAALVGAFSVSVMRAAFTAALDFAKKDSRGGTVPLIQRQSVADLLINIKMRMDSCRLLTWKALYSLENGPGDFKARQELCLESKIFASDNCVKCVTDAMSAVGMLSYRTDQPFARLLNDAMCLPLFDGGNIGIRRRQMEKIFQQEDYDPMSAF